MIEQAAPIPVKRGETVRHLELNRLIVDTKTGPEIRSEPQGMLSWHFKLLFAGT